MPTPTQIQPAPVKASPIPEQDVRDLLTPASRQKSLSKRLTGVVATLGWTALFLGLLDAGVNCLLAYPQDPLVTNPPKLPLYFEYGRSIEGKLDRMIGNSDETSAPLTQAGWIDDPKLLAALPTRAESENGTCVAAYGMSFTFRVSDAAKQLDPNLTVRGRGGPAAPLNHSYALFRDDLGRHDARYAVIGVLASSFPAFNSMSHLTWNFEFPGVFTYPRYEFQNGELRAVDTGVDSLKDFRNVRRFSATRSGFSQTLAQHDAFYSPFLYEQNVLDSSSVLRMIRRACWQRHKRNVEAR